MQNCPACQFINKLVNENELLNKCDCINCKQARRLEKIKESIAKSGHGVAKFDVDCISSLRDLTNQVYPEAKEIVPKDGFKAPSYDKNKILNELKEWLKKLMRKVYLKKILI